MSPNNPRSKQSGPTTKFGRLVVFDREIFIQICRRMVNGEDLEAICSEPGMPIGPMFLGWVQDHQEAREIYRSVRNLKTDRALAKELGLVLPIPSSEWEEQVRANLDRGWPADWIDRKYIGPDWNKVYPEIGDPPAWATESRQAYDDLIDSMTQMLQPRDLMELIWTKEATDARWEASRASREKNSLPERKYQQRLQTEAQYRPRGAAEAPVTKPATALDHSRGLEASFKFYQGHDVMQARKIKISNNAVRQIERWRDGLGATPRQLPDRFVSEQALAKRYGVDPCVADAEIDAAVGEPVAADRAIAPQVDAPPLPPTGAVAEAAPPIDPTGKPMEAALPLAAEVATDDAAQTAAPFASSGEATGAAPPLDGSAGGAEAAPTLAPAADAVEAVPDLTLAGHSAHGAPALAPLPEPAEAAAVRRGADPLVPGGTQAARPRTDALEAAPPLTSRERGAPGHFQ